MRQMKRDGTPVASIARMFGVARGTVHFIIARKTWNHLP
jgi:DNA invertase Pin-like site-specific DNA recombinase